MIKSLTGRLMLVSSLVALVFLPLAGFVLERAYTASMDSRLQEQLKIQVYSLMGLADELEPGVLWLPEALPDERFNQLASGRYARLTDAYGKELWRSQSTIGIDLPKPLPDVLGEMRIDDITVPGEFYFQRQTTANNQMVEIAQVTIIWEGPGDTENLYTFQVAENLEGYYFEIATFRKTLITWLGGLAGFLLLVNLAAMFWALKPFQHLSDSIQEIESGRRQALDTDYPSELNQIASNINALIRHERSQRGRYRNTLQDLAHSLKTPLSVLTGLRNQIHDAKVRDELTSMTKRMNSLISYQLQKAVSGGEAPIKERILIKPNMLKLCGALEKVYRDKKINFEIDVPEEAVFFGDQNDLMEIAGNLLDNGCKYGHGAVSIRCRDTKGDKIQLDFYDNGPGVSMELRTSIFERGTRLDENIEGQGIGLAVVRDIVSAYRGEISWLENDTGHAVRITLPGERSPENPTTAFS